MIASYPFDVTALDLNPGLAQNTQKNLVLSMTLGDTIIKVEPTAQPGLTFECPAKILRNGGCAGSGFIPTNTGRGPHQDYLFMRDSVEYTYTTRVAVAAGVIEKQMPVGAVVGQEGRMILYKGATLTTVDVGGWSERLIRPFLIVAADLTNRETGWPVGVTGSVPTVDVASKSVVDNSGDGYNHI